MIGVVVAHIVIDAISIRHLHACGLVIRISFSYQIHALEVVQRIYLAPSRERRHIVRITVAQVVLRIPSEEVRTTSMELFLSQNVQTEEYTRCRFVLVVCKCIAGRTRREGKVAIGAFHVAQRCINSNQGRIGISVRRVETRDVEHIHLAVGHIGKARTHFSVEGPGRVSRTAVAFMIRFIQIQRAVRVHIFRGTHGRHDEHHIAEIGTFLVVGQAAQELEGTGGCRRTRHEGITARAPHGIADTAQGVVLIVLETRQCRIYRPDRSLGRYSSACLLRYQTQLMSRFIFKSTTGITGVVADEILFARIFCSVFVHIYPNGQEELVTRLKINCQTCIRRCPTDCPHTHRQ